MTEENIFRSPFAPIEIPEMSSGEYLYKQLKSFENKKILVSKWLFK
jgi:hypothetical protein